MSHRLYSKQSHVNRLLATIIAYSSSVLLSTAYATSQIGQVTTVPKANVAVASNSQETGRPKPIGNGPNRPANSDKVWDRVLPIGGQVAIYNGYDLPLPFGISFLYSHIEQDQSITNLKVGYGGPANTKIDFLSFDTFRSKTDTPQLKIDAWILPFLNVFATVGRIKGTIDIKMSMPKGSVATSDPVTNAVNDGIQAYCSNNPRKCKVIGNNLPDNKPNIFNGDPWQLNAEAEIEGYNYSFGAMLAGASGDWFYTMPIVYTQTDMEKTNVSGGTLNIQPRIGYNFSLDYGIDLALYTGASYMDSRQHLSGGFNLETMESTQDYDAPHTIAFSVDQENTNKWAGIIGFNLNVNKHFSTALEYTGLIGDREQLILMVNGRF